MDWDAWAYRVAAQHRALGNYRIADELEQTVPVREHLPSVQGEGAGPTVTLRDLIELVTVAQRLDLDLDATIVRGEAIPFRVADLGATGGSVMKSLALDRLPDDLGGKNPAARKRRR